jgi:hypothetical protein
MIDLSAVRPSDPPVWSDDLWSKVSNDRLYHHLPLVVCLLDEADIDHPGEEVLLLVIQAALDARASLAAASVHYLDIWELEALLQTLILFCFRPALESRVM